MIEETDEGVVVSCDDCSTELVMNFHSRDRIHRHLAMRNWAILEEPPGSGEYHYRCPCCVDQANQARQVRVLARR